MSTYAAVVSLLNTMDHIQNHPHISLAFDQKQIESLRLKVDLLLDFIEDNNDHGGSQLEAQFNLESQIRCAANAAEDVIESHIVDQIQAAASFSMLDLHAVIKEMDFLKEKAMVKLNEERRFIDLQQSTYSMPVANSSRSLMTTDKNIMIGFDEELIQLMDALTGRQSSRQIISIVGMGGMGKTTLARNVYENLLIVQHFEIRSWVTIAQKNREETLLQLLSCLEKNKENNDRKTEDELGERLYKTLYGRRYLIVLDDTWSIGDWENIKTFIPNNDNGSRILVTTRQSDVVIGCGLSLCFPMKFLDEDKSWDLFCEKAFGQASCPCELEKIGKKIVEKCTGLPLSLSVIGGLLGKSSMTQKYWENVAKNINAFLNSGEGVQCLDILSLSYSHLPVHLKPCFLYMGIFPQDHEIRVSQLVQLWVAEGFLKPNKARSMEEIAEDYLKDLIDRNLILISKLGSKGNVKACIIHDLLRDLCLMMSLKENFLCVVRNGIDAPRVIKRGRRIVLHEKIRNKYFRQLQSASLFARSLICGRGSKMTYKFRLLRVLNVVDEKSLEGIFDQLVNLRYFACIPNHISSPCRELSLLSISLLWNLETLILSDDKFNHLVVPSQIWEMPQLRHVEFYRISLPDPPTSDQVGDQRHDLIVLQNLQTLKGVEIVRLSKEMCKRIPNVKKLHLYCDYIWEKRPEDYYCYQNLVLLYKLESLKCSFYYTENLVSLAFPMSLKKLCLLGLEIVWEDMTIIGSLPRLEVLKLDGVTECGPEWNPVEGQFARLKFLKITYCSDLRHWNAESFHFPALENLALTFVYHLDEIPLGIGEIATLGLIQLDQCSGSAAISAAKILEELENQGNEGFLQVRVKFELKEEFERFKQEMALDNFTSNNLQLEYMYT